MSRWPRTALLAATIAALMKASHKDILDEIVKSGKIDEATDAKMKAIFSAFTKNFSV